MRFRCVESSTNLLLAMAMTLTMAIAMGKDMTMSNVYGYVKNKYYTLFCACL